MRNLKTANVFERLGASLVACKNQMQMSHTFRLQKNKTETHIEEQVADEIQIVRAISRKADYTANVALVLCTIYQRIANLNNDLYLTRTLDRDIVIVRRAKYVLLYVMYRIIYVCAITERCFVSSFYEITIQIDANIDDLLFSFF